MYGVQDKGATIAEAMQTLRIGVCSTPSTRKARLTHVPVVTRRQRELLWCSKRFILHLWQGFRVVRAVTGFPQKDY